MIQQPSGVIAMIPQQGFVTALAVKQNNHPIPYRATRMTSYCIMMEGASEGLLLTSTNVSAVDAKSS